MSSRWHGNHSLSAWETLEDYMLPKFVEFCEILPKTASGKVRVERMPLPATQGDEE